MPRLGGAALALCLCAGALALPRELQGETPHGSHQPTAAGLGMPVQHSPDGPDPPGAVTHP